MWRQNTSTKAHVHQLWHNNYQHEPVSNEYLQITICDIIKIVWSDSFVGVRRENGFVVTETSNALHSHTFPRVQNSFQILTFNTTTQSTSKHIKLLALFHLIVRPQFFLVAMQLFLELFPMLAIRFKNNLSIINQFILEHHIYYAQKAQFSITINFSWNFYNRKTNLI